MKSAHGTNFIGCRFIVCLAGQDAGMGCRRETVERTMRGFVPYVAAAFCAAILADVTAPPAAPGRSAFGNPAPQSDSFHYYRQSVDRTHKSDRLDARPTFGKRQAPSKPAPIMIGCDPAFSPLSGATSANFPGRCAA